MTQANSSNSSNSSSTHPSGSIVYVSSHGVLPDVSSTTFVPDGMRAVFYARDGEALLSLVEGIVLSVLHETGVESPVGRPDGSITVPNYRLDGFDDLAVAVRVQLAAVEADRGSESTRLYFVGGNHLDSPIRLCADPGQNGCRPPRHNCRGVFGVLKDFSEIRFMCCRRSQSNGAITQTLVNDPDPERLEKVLARAAYFDKMIGEAPGQVTEDPDRLDEAEKYYQRLVTDDDRAELLIYADLAGIWLEIAAARRHRAEHGDWGLIVYYLSNPPTARKHISQNSGLRRILTAGESRLTALTREGPTPANIAWFRGCSDRARKWLTIFAGPRHIAAALRRAGVDTARDAGWALTAYIQLQSISDARVAVGRLFDPDLIAITTNAQVVLDRWNDPMSLDSDLENEWNSWPDEERYALRALDPDAVAAWCSRVGYHDGF